MTLNTVPVRFSVNAQTHFGETVVVCGNIPELGMWETTAAPEMRYVEGKKTWAVTLQLPKGGGERERRPFYFRFHAHTWVPVHTHTHTRVPVHTHTHSSVSSLIRTTNACNASTTPTERVKLSIQVCDWGGKGGTTPRRKGGGSSGRRGGDGGRSGEEGEVGGEGEEGGGA